MKWFNKSVKRTSQWGWAALALVIAPLSGCDGVGQPVLLPFGQITAVQLFNESNYTVAFSVESAVLNPTSVARVNWVFGDGGGFVEGPSDRATITHRYSAPGTYAVTAYIFGSGGFVDQITTNIVVDQNGVQPPPNGQNPEDLPGNISAPFPVNNAAEVAVDIELFWTTGILSDSQDVYFGTDKDAVADATRSDDAFKGNQTGSTFDPGMLDPNTTYYWRIDGVNELGTTKGSVLTFKTARVPQQARNPIPSHGSTSARVEVILRWTSGERASSHDVYFGKDAVAVADATDEDDDIFQGNVNSAQFDPEDEDAERDGQLLPDTEYFWRIDEVGTGGTTKGEVWSFRTAAAPPKVTMPIPFDGEIDVDVEQVLSWVASPDIEQVDIYLGTDAVDVEEADRGSPLFQITQSSTTFDPPNLLGSTTYYWRIDTIGRGGTTKGDIFSFATIAPPGQVIGPFVPANVASNVTITPELSWNVGGNGPTTQFRVYLSTSNSAVVSGAASALRTTQDVQFTTFKIVEASSLTADTTYFWRVDAIGPGGVTTGPVLNFTTGSKPPAVTGPIPQNSAKGIALNVTLMWTAATGADSYDVYFGTSQSEVNSANNDDAPFRATVNVTNYVPGVLEGDTEFFWRIDSRGPGGATKGSVWRFTTVPPKATVPVPFDGADQIALDVSLEWSAGRSATSHDVYLGTDEAAVTNATRQTAGIFRGNQTATTYTPPNPLAGATTYYWRIDGVNIDGTSKGDVWQFTTIAGQATDPIPADGATGVSLTPSLDWTPDVNATSHHVFFGTTEDAVESATTASDEYQGSFTLGGGTPPFQPPNVLDGLTFYFWRVDTITANGTAKGHVWRFRTGPGRASNPTPANFATGVSVNTTLMWTAGVGAVTHDVYFGTNEADVTNSNIGSLVGATLRVTTGVTQISTPQMPPLAANTVYYWRVDSVASNGTTRTTGVIWRFTTLELPAQAASPTPFNGATNINPEVTLTWGSAARADSYDVYFGDSMAAVMNATTASTEFQGNQATTSYQPTGLATLTTYYWRIDTVNEAGVRVGVVWSFTTRP